MLKSLAQEIIAHAAARLPLRPPLEKSVVDFALIHGWDASDTQHQRLLVSLALLNSALRKMAARQSIPFFPTPLDSLNIETPDSLTLSIADWARGLRSAEFNPLGELYTLLVPQARRRLMGQFWTGESLAEWMVAWLLETGPRTLLDAGCGAGNFLLKAAQLLRERESKADLYGFDLSTLLLNVTRSAFVTGRGDSLDLMPKLSALDYMNAELQSSPTRLSAIRLIPGITI